MSKDLGTKHVCFKCATKFYDLKKPVPACPKCGVDQRTKPAAAPKTAPKRVAAPPEARSEGTDEAESESEQDGDLDDDSTDDGE
jgi:uncharacterized protein (TIGR02300 family)